MRQTETNAVEVAAVKILTLRRSRGDRVPRNDRCDTLVASLRAAVVERIRVGEPVREDLIHN